MLPPRVFDCLAYLVEHRDRAVGRDELLSAVWGRTTAGESLLAQTISRLRQVIDDDNEDQRIIRTVPRFGYRWAISTSVEHAPEATDPGRPPHAAPPSEPTDAPAGVVGESPARTNANDPPTAHAPLGREPEAAPAPARARPGWRRGTPMIALAIAAAIVAGAALLIARRVPAPVAPTQVLKAPSIAPTVVLPVVGKFGDDQTWIRLGIMDYIAGRLRTAGIPTASSENTLALLRDADEKQSAESRVRAVMGGHVARIIALKAEQTERGWRITAENFEGAASPAPLAADGASAIDAARLLSERIATTLLGNTARISASDDVPPGKLELIQKIDAALLEGNLDEARALVTRSPSPLRETPAIRYREARLQYLAGAYDDAVRLCETLRSQVSVESDPALRAEVLRLLGSVDIMKGDFKGARDHYDAALAAAQVDGDESLIGKMLVLRGSAISELGDTDSAERDFAAARSALGNAGDELSLARLDTHIAMAESHHGHLQAAVDLFRRSIDTFGRYGAKGERTAVEITLFEPLQELLEHADALRLSETLVAETAQSHNKPFYFNARLIHLRALFSVGRTREALDEMHALLADADLAKPEVAAARARVLAVAAEWEAANGNKETALADARTALPLVPFDREVGRLRRLLAALARDSTAPSTANADEGSSDTPTLRFFAALIAADTALASGDTDERTSDALRRAAAAAVDSGAPVDSVEVARLWMPLLIKQKDFDQAALWAGRTERWAANDYDAALLQFAFHDAFGRGAAAETARERVRAVAGERPVP